MTGCKQVSFEFPELKLQKIEVNFSGGEVTSDGGVLLLREVDRRIGPTTEVVKHLKDNRIHEVFVKKFIESFKNSVPEELILDLDATDDRVHGNQVNKFFHGYYDDYCFLPLYVFCGDQLLVSYLRPSNIDGAKHAWAICALLIKRLREEWSDVKIIVRADSGFCHHRMLTWFEKHGVKYITGLAGNSILQMKAMETKLRSKAQFQDSGIKQKLFLKTIYAAKAWSCERRVIIKAEYSDQGENTRFAVSNLEGSAQDLYEKIYCARREMENRIKEQQLCLFADRTSCHEWWPNQFRLLLSSLAYVLVETIRRTAQQKTELAQAQVSTIRLKLFKIGAVIVRNTRRVKLFLSSYYPHKHLFFNVVQALNGTS